MPRGRRSGGGGAGCVGAGAGPGGAEGEAGHWGAGAGDVVGGGRRGPGSGGPACSVCDGPNGRTAGAGTGSGAGRLGGGAGWLAATGGGRSGRWRRGRSGGRRWLGIRRRYRLGRRGVPGRRAGGPRATAPAGRAWRGRGPAPAAPGRARTGPWTWTAPMVAWAPGWRQSAGGPPGGGRAAAAGKWLRGSASDWAAGGRAFGGAVGWNDGGPGSLTGGGIWPAWACGSEWTRRRPGLEHDAMGFRMGLRLGLGLGLDVVAPHRPAGPGLAALRRESFRRVGRSSNTTPKPPMRSLMRLWRTLSSTVTPDPDQDHGGCRR